MSLSISNFFQAKSVKLSDSYIVTIKFPEEESFSIVNCTGFTVPKIEYNEEIMYYGNVSQSFLIPKYDSIKEMSIKFLESENESFLQKFIKNEDPKNENNSSFLNLGKGYTLEQKKAKNGYSINYGTYDIDTFDLEELRIDVYDNTFDAIVYTYLFNNLKIIKYEMYELDYSSESPCEFNMTFMFEGYARGADLKENDKFVKNKLLKDFDLGKTFKTDTGQGEKDKKRAEEATRRQKERQDSLKKNLKDIKIQLSSQNVGGNSILGGSILTIPDPGKGLERNMKQNKIKAKNSLDVNAGDITLKNSYVVEYDALKEITGEDFIKDILKESKNGFDAENALNAATQIVTQNLDTFFTDEEKNTASYEFFKALRDNEITEDIIKGISNVTKEE